MKAAKAKESKRRRVVIVKPVKAVRWEAMSLLKELCCSVAADLHMDTGTNIISPGHALPATKMWSYIS
eukprot:m.64394 g.64394  ORF g.64394 m.64394 type:complete len:68 (+) comp12012_c1_seq1:197-400(+)